MKFLRMKKNMYFTTSQLIKYTRNLAVCVIFGTYFQQIRDGRNEDSELIKRFCETSAFSVAASQHFMFIRFINGGHLKDLVVSAEYFVFGKFAVAVVIRITLLNCRK